MYCHICALEGDPQVETYVIDSRPLTNGFEVRRRHKCIRGHKFSTTERRDGSPVSILKRSGHRQPFNIEKLAASVRLACKGLDIVPDQTDAMIDDVAERVRTGIIRDTQSVAELVMQKLSAMHPTAYIRYAAGHHSFSEQSVMRVRKRSGGIEDFSRHKLLSGIEKALHKLPQAHEAQTIAQRVERLLRTEYGDAGEVPCEVIGNLVVEELWKVSPVAWASFNRVFRDVVTMDELLPIVLRASRAEGATSSPAAKSA